MAEMNTNVKIKKSKTKISDKTFNVILTTIATIILIIFLYPMIFVVSSSFSSGEAVTAGAVVLWPVDFSLDGYKWILKNNIIYAIFSKIKVSEILNQWKYRIFLAH